MIKQIETCSLRFFRDTSHSTLLVSMTSLIKTDYVQLTAKQLRDLATAATDMAETLEAQQFDIEYAAKEKIKKTSGEKKIPTKEYDPDLPF